MSKKKKTSFTQPPVPASLRFCETRKIMRQGRKDAKKSQGVKDFSRTQAVNTYESASQQGEIDLNDWLLRVTAPYISGNARIEQRLDCYARKSRSLVNSRPPLGVNVPEQPRV